MCFRKPALAGVFALAMLAGCNPAQLATANRYAEEIARTCEQALIVEPMFPWIKPWVVDCRTAAGIAKAAMDPFYHEWLRGILGRL